MTEYKRPALKLNLYKQIDSRQVKYGYQTFNDAVKALFNEFER